MGEMVWYSPSWKQEWETVSSQLGEEGAGRWVGLTA